MKVLVCDGLHPSGLELLRSAREVEKLDVLEKPLQGEDFVKVASSFDFLVLRSATKLGASDLGSLPQLKGVLRAGVGLDNVDLKAASELGIYVWNAPSGNFQSTAELALAQIFAMARGLVAATEAARKGEWLKAELSKSGRQLSGSTLGIFGFGNIGQRLARMAQGIGMRVLICDPYYQGGEYSRLDWENFLSSSDFFSIHAPLTSETQGIFNRKAFAQMKKGSFLVNCARGGIVDEEALLEALEKGQLAGAGLDVFSVEPFDIKNSVVSRLLKHPKVVLTPHVGASTQEAQKVVGEESAGKIIQIARALKNQGRAPKPVCTPQSPRWNLLLES